MKIYSSLLFILFFSVESLAIRVIQIKGNKVLLDLEEESVSADQKLYLLNSDNKKIAVVTITESKKGRAVAVLNKGKLDGATSAALIAPAETSLPKSETKPTISTEAPDSKNEPIQSDNEKIFRLNGIKLSSLLTIASNNMTTKQADGTQPVPNQEDVALRGTSIGITGTVDYPFYSWLILRGTLGYEPFNVAGTSNFLSCNVLTSTSCTADINYLSAGGYVRIDLTKSRTTVWLAGGGSSKIPLSKTTTALKSDDIGMTFTIAGAVGIDQFINNRNYIPISLEYQLFQSSDTVSASIVMLRAGYGWAF